MTDTQILILETLSKQDFIFSGDEILQKTIEEDYKNLRYKKAKEDMKKIGVAINKQKWIEGQNTKVHIVENKELFKMALDLIET